MVIDDLPTVDMAEVDATALCDPEVPSGNPDAGEPTIACFDGLELALRDLRTVTQDPVMRLYLQRPACASMPCSDDELDTAHVTLWTASQAFDVGLDSRLDTMAPPLIATNPVWPSPDAATVPPVRRPTIKGAPRAVANREPYPYCGRATLYEPPEVFDCFLDAVLAGRPAEMIHRLYSTEGETFIWIYRYDGQGRVLGFLHSKGPDVYGNAYETWQRTEGAIDLGGPLFQWGLDPWEATNRKLKLSS